MLLLLFILSYRESDKHFSLLLEGPNFEKKRFMSD
jgi:hypothetical protein